FYFTAADRLQVACRLAAKAITQGKRLLIYAPDSEAASRIDRMLWTWPAIGFVPHCAAHDALAAETPVLIGAGEEPAAGGELLLNLGGECPPHFERLAPEVDRVITEKLANTLNQVLGQALEGVRAELTSGVTQLVREAVAASVSRALALPDSD